MAIIVPAWHESDVIAVMIENLVSTVEYGTYVLFIGTYPNDPGMIAEVDRVCRRFPQVRRVEVAHPGPTCKADCLNAVIQALLDHERRAGITFAGIVMHDSEDVLHPIELKYFNYLMPRMDLIQIPVASLERDYLELVAGTYMDEFAVARQGSRRARVHLRRRAVGGGGNLLLAQGADGAVRGDGQPTVQCREPGRGLRHRHAPRGARHEVDLRPLRRPVSDNQAHLVRLGAYQSARAHHAAVRARIFPQPFPRRLSSTGALGARHQLPGLAADRMDGLCRSPLPADRDRSVIFTPFVAMAAYVVFGILAAYWLWGGAWFAHWRMTSTIFASPIAQWLLFANLVLVLWRIAQRVYFVNQIYGFDHALLSIPHLAWPTTSSPSPRCYAPGACSWGMSFSASA